MAAISYFTPGSLYAEAASRCLGPEFERLVEDMRYALDRETIEDDDDPPVSLDRMAEAAGELLNYMDPDNVEFEAELESGADPESRRQALLALKKGLVDTGPYGMVLRQLDGIAGGDSQVMQGMLGAEGGVESFLAALDSAGKVIDSFCELPVASFREGPFNVTVVAPRETRLAESPRATAEKARAALKEALRRVQSTGLARWIRGPIKVTISSYRFLPFPGTRGSQGMVRPLSRHIWLAGGLPYEQLLRTTIHELAHYISYDMWEERRHLGLEEKVKSDQTQFAPEDTERLISMWENANTKLGPGMTVSSLGAFMQAIHDFPDLASEADRKFAVDLVRRLSYIVPGVVSGNLPGGPRDLDRVFDDERVTRTPAATMPYGESNPQEFLATTLETWLMGGQSAVDPEGLRMVKSLL